ncbi:MAG: hypothetical protein JKY52_18935 [Flavobacteriales bacterium]|nr:hypothetical protein [Flavobacteriales bacterium]
MNEYKIAKGCVIFIYCLALVLTGCNKKESNFARDFGDCLTSDQIAVILSINEGFDQFVLQGYNDGADNLEGALLNYVKAIDEAGSWDDFFLRKNQLADMQKEIENCGLDADIYTVKRDLNLQGQYFKCMKEVALDNKDINGLYQTIQVSGDRLSLNMFSGPAAYLAKSDLLHSTAKSLLIFECVSSQIEREKATSEMKKQ